MEQHKGMHKLPRHLDVPKFPVGMRFGSAGELRVRRATGKVYPAWRVWLTARVIAFFLVWNQRDGRAALFADVCAHGLGSLMARSPSSCSTVEQRFPSAIVALVPSAQNDGILTLSIEILITRRSRF